MSGRPEVLFPLFAGLEKLAGVGPKTSEHMVQMGIEKPRDLIFTLPYSVVDRRRKPRPQPARIAFHENVRPKAPRASR